MNITVSGGNYSACCFCGQCGYCTFTFMTTTLTREQFHSLWLQGEEVAFVLYEQLLTRVVALEEQQAKDSGNSSKPPSSDGYKKKPLQPMTVSLRKKTGKKVGGQPGHAGTTLEQAVEPDQVVVHRPDCCPDCQASLVDAALAPESLVRRQGFEMPVPKVVVTEHQTPSLLCPGCGKSCRAAFPDGATQPVQYGPNLLGFATYLQGVHLLPFERCAQVVREVTGAPFSPGSLARALQTVHGVLAPFEVGVREALAHALVLHVDETGTRVAGKLQRHSKLCSYWFHTRCTPLLTFLFRHERRGAVAVEDLLRYTGILVSDFLSSYVKLSCKHAYCGAHILRELVFQAQVRKQGWAKALIDLLEGAVSACHQARESGTEGKGLADRGRLEAAYDRLVAEGLRENPPPLVGKATPAVNLLERLEAYKPSCLRFLSDLSVPFTNNQAERDLRMLKVKGKISGGFRTTEGADQYCRLRSYLATCRRQVLALLDCCPSLFNGRLITPALIA